MPMLGCTTVEAVGKDHIDSLPRMGSTDANVIRTAVGDLPTRRHVQRLSAIFDIRSIIDFVNMQRHVQVGAVALGERWRGGERS